MLTANPEETKRVVEYMESQAPDLSVTFTQKVYSENVLSHRHDVWDVHTDKDRWWVITEPMNLYAQDQFPNMDLALTFHIGLCLRMPRSEKKDISELNAEPLGKTCRYLSEAGEALSHAEEVSDYQAIGVRCRESLLSFIESCQTVLPWTSTDPAPKKADLKAWANHICGAALPGSSQRERRRLYRTLLECAWDFANWLTHAKGTKWHGAEAGFSVTENALGLCMSAAIVHLRGVPEVRPACGSHRLTPQRAFNPNVPDEEWERASCMKCDWVGEPVLIESVPAPPDRGERPPPEGECIVSTVPLRKLHRPGDLPD